MARVAINTGSTANDGTGDTLRAAGGIINSNFSDIYNYFGDGTNLSFSGGNFVVTAAGINTLSNVGIGTTNPRFDLEVGAVGASGTSLWVNGNARVTGILTVGTASIVLDGASNTITVGSGVTINGSGVISATQFSGDGSGLTGVTAVGSGVAIQDSGASVGAAATIINFADNLTVSSSSAGIVTVTSSASGGGGTGYWEQNATGIHTTSNVGIGTTTASSALTISGDVSVSGVITATTFVGNLNGNADTATSATYSTSSGIATYATVSGVSTNVSGGVANVSSLNATGISTLGTVQVSSGIVNATSGVVTYYGDASNAADGRWTLGASGTDHYVFSGIGITGGLQNDPTLHLQRGRVYEFVNEMGAHPFQIQQEYQNTSGEPYEVGVSNNGVTNGTLRWEVPFNAPNTLYYQCTSHVGMSGTIHITPSGYDEPIGFRTTRTVTTSSLGAGSSESVSIQGFKTYGLLKVDIGNAAWVTLYTDSASRTADASARTHLQDPVPGSGVIAEVYTESTGSSSFKMSPGVIGWNNDSPTENTIYLRVLNNESTSTAIGVTVTLVKMED